MGGSWMGLDVGTRSLAACTWLDGAPVPVPDEDGRVLHCADVVVDSDGSLLTGGTARALSGAPGTRTITHLAALVGRPFFHGTVKALAGRVGVPLHEGLNHAVELDLGDRRATPEQLAIRVVTGAREAAQKFTGNTLTSVAAALPAGADDAQKAAWLAVLMAAGFEDVRLVDAVHAVGSAAGLGAGSGTVAIFHLSEESLDVTVARESDGVLHAVTSAGNPHLGGADFDEHLMQWAMDDLAARHGMDPAVSPEGMAALRSAAAEAVTAMMDADAAELRVPPQLPTRDGKELPATLSVTPAVMNSACMDMLQRIFKILDEAVQQAGLTPTQVDHVVRVGAVTRLPVLAKGLQRYFKKAPVAGPDPRIIAAAGALVVASDTATAAPAAGVPSAPPSGVPADGGQVHAALDQEAQGLLALALALESRGQALRSQELAEASPGAGAAARVAALEDLLGVLKGLADALGHLRGLAPRSPAAVAPALATFAEHRKALEKLVFALPG